LKAEKREREITALNEKMEAEVRRLNAAAREFVPTTSGDGSEASSSLPERASSFDLALVIFFLDCSVVQTLVIFFLDCSVVQTPAFLDLPLVTTAPPFLCSFEVLPPFPEPQTHCRPSQ